MHDTGTRFPNLSALFDVASEQHGYFTTAQARARGIGTNLIAHHVRSGRFIPVHRGVYRLRDFPFSSYEDVVAAWLALGKDSTVVSHETALDLLGITNVTPNAIHLTVPRSRRYRTAPPGVELHTTMRSLDPGDLASRHGITITGPIRTILDSAETGSGPEQIEMAIQEGVRRGMFMPERLRDEAGHYSSRVRDLVRRALDTLPP